MQHHGSGWKRHFFPRFAQGGVGSGFTLVHAATGEADLTTVIAQVHRPLGEQHLGAVGAVVQHHQYG